MAKKKEESGGGEGEVEYVAVHAHHAHLGAVLPRVFSLEVHGEHFLALAEEFAKTNSTEAKPAHIEKISEAKAREYQAHVDHRVSQAQQAAVSIPVSAE